MGGLIVVVIINNNLPLYQRLNKELKVQECDANEDQLKFNCPVKKYFSDLKSDGDFYSGE